MLAKLNESPAGKVGVVVLAVVAVVGAVFMGIRSASGDGSKVADEKEVQAAAQKQIDVLEKENLPPALKAEMIAHQKGILNSSSHGANTPPPTSGN